MLRHVWPRVAVALLFVLAVAAAADARQGPPAPAPGQSGLVFAPEIRVTSIDGSSGELIGGYAGWLRRDGLLLGAGGYGLVSGGGETGMSYGGFVAAYSLPVSDLARVGVRGLVGVGKAHLWVPVPPPAGWDDCFSSPYLCESILISVGEHPSFVVFEPQVTVESRVGRRVSVEVGAGYRVIGNAEGYASRLQGVFGSVGVRIGPF
jgi:hypothetical protein